jgi:hypothetical protein
MTISVLGLDISANRVAWAWANEKEFRAHLHTRGMMSWQSFVNAAAADIRAALQEYGHPPVCLEINLHPKIIYCGHPSPDMIRDYMRCRWVEGAIIRECCYEEPQIIRRIHGGHYEVPPDTRTFALQATGGVAAKKKRRDRMRLLYDLRNRELSEDEVDALAIAHDCVVALKAGMRKGK